MTIQGLQTLQPLKLIGESLQPRPSAPFARVACLESDIYMRNQLLRDADWAGMAHSLEIRVPLVDSTLLHELAALAVRDEVWSKQRLAAAPSRPLPAMIAGRAKTGFTTPVADWQQRAVLPRGRSSGGLRPWSRTVFARLGHRTGIPEYG
jgi:asparagine synthase (glutamine-hydrolysing)